MRTLLTLFAYLGLAFSSGAEPPYFEICKTYDGRECNAPVHSPGSEAAQTAAAATAFHVVPALINAFSASEKKAEAYRRALANSPRPNRFTDKDLEANRELRRREAEKPFERVLKPVDISDVPPPADNKEAREERDRRILESIRRDIELLKKEREDREKARLHKEFLDAGGIDEERFLKLQQKLHDAAYNSQDIDDAVDALRSLDARYKRAQSDPVRAQLDPLMDELIDDRGLIKPWLDFAPALKGYNFHTSAESTHGHAIRRIANHALGLAKIKANEEGIREKVDYLIDTIIKADSAFDSSVDGDSAYRTLLGKRLLRRSEDFYRFANPNDESEQLKMPPKAIELFGLNSTDIRTFAGLEIWKVASHAIRLPNIESDELLRFHLTTSLQQAQNDANSGDWKSAVRSVDRAWSIVDYAKGFTKGLIEFGVETVKGISDLVLHPIDSVDAIATALINYDKTYDAIVEQIQKVWNEYESYSPEEKGNFWGHAAGQIMSAVSGGSLIKLAKDAKVLAGITAAAKHLEPLVDLAKIGKLTYVGKSTWVSGAGLIYGWDKNFGNRVRHILEHFTPDPGKKVHSVFSIDRSEVLPLIDQAWINRGSAMSSGPRDIYVICLGKRIGTNGETRLRIITERGTSQLVSAYPVH